MLDLQFLHNLDKLYLIIPNDLKLRTEILDEIATIVQQGIKTKSPVITGTLRDSIQKSVNPSLARVWTDLFYAPYVQYGTKQHIIEATKAKALHWDNLFYTKVSHPGSKANQFFFDSGNDVPTDIISDVSIKLSEKSFEQLFYQK